MRVSNWTILGYAIGLAFSLFSGIRYFLIFYDLDRAIVYIAIGGIICGLAWLYNRQLEISNTLTAIEDYLDDKK